MGESLIPNESDGSISVFIDESFGSLVAAAAVIVETTEADDLDRKIASAFERIRGWHYMRDLPSFELFLEEGFHAAKNPPEVYNDFVNLLAETAVFKSLIVYSDRSKRPDLSDKERLMVIYDQLVRDVIRTYQGRPKIVFCFESTQKMDRFVERVTFRAAHLFGRAIPEIEVRFGSKREPELLAIPDYVLHIFMRWFSSPNGDEAPARNPRQREWRAVKAILGSISVARCLDNGTAIRRDHP